jgi:hypothetical protein
MDKEFVPYDIAVALKELGFDEECLDLYWHSTKHWRKGTLVSSNIAEHTKELCIKAPLYQQAFRWFREKYKLNHVVEFKYSEYYGYILDSDFCGWYKSYEEAQEVCLRKLIEIVKENLKKKKIIHIFV